MNDHLESQTVDEILREERRNDVIKLLQMTVDWIKEDVLPEYLNTADEFFWQDKITEYEQEIERLSGNATP